MTIPEAAAKWAVAIANDQKHGYSQQNRWGNPDTVSDFDCSSFVLSAYKAAGANIGNATYTGNMRSELLKHGFKDVTAKCNLNTQKGLQPGDILMWHKGGTNGHTAMYIGNGKIVHARGQSYGSPAPGDQGSEIAVCPYYRGSWQYVFRYTGNEPAKDTSTSGANAPVSRPTQKRYAVSTTLPIVKYGSVGRAVMVWQTIVGVEADGEFGKNTKAATLAFQKSQGLEQDAEVGSFTWGAGLKTIS